MSADEQIPGLKRRPRKDGTRLYWIPPARDVLAGYTPKSIAFSPRLSEAEVAEKCRHMQADLENWRIGKRGPPRHSIAWLINRYQTDPFSPYAKLKPSSKRSYDGCVRMIEAIHRDRLIGFQRDGSTPLITGEVVRLWFHKWGLPDDSGKPTAPSRARHMITQFRVLISYAVELNVPSAIEMRKALSAMRFEAPQAREIAPTRAQVLAIVEKAKAMGVPSIAATTLAQYELIERRIHILGSWQKNEWEPGWVWEGISPDWVITYFQNKKGRVLREFNLVSVQPLLSLLQELAPKGERHGPVMVCEKTGLPWREKHYTDTFREIARAAGIPDTIWSMDMRAGGGTEADLLGVPDRMLQDAFGHLDPKTKDRYRRQKQRNAQNVVELRQERLRRTSENES